VQLRDGGEGERVLKGESREEKREREREARGIKREGGERDIED
jgi:hypothetical protein